MPWSAIGRRRSGWTEQRDRAAFRAAQSLRPGKLERTAAADNEYMHRRGLDLLSAHLVSLDPDAPTARERLDAELGAALAAFLVEALSVRVAA